MDGTAIYEAVAVIFLCQLWGIDLSFTEVLIVMVTASMAAIGAAGIPSAGVITMLIVIGAVNQSLAGRGVEQLPEFNTAFRNDFGGMKSLLLDHLQSSEPFGPIELNKKAVKKFIDEHMSSNRDHSQRLFTLLTLSIWAKSL